MTHDTKHTPGPWSLVQHSKKRKDRLIADEKTGHFICDVYGKAGQPVEENARLIAAAPELLESLDSFPGFADPTPSQLEWLDMVNRLRAKARGQNQ